MTGEFRSDAADRVQELLAENPNLETIVMLDVPGSLDDEACLKAGRLVRDAGINTVVPDDGEIASGGVDFFLAGVRREVQVGGQVGVHSWSHGPDEGTDFPRSHRFHQLYLDYLADMAIAEDFYWFTLEAAESNDIHWMTRDELVKYQVVTQ